MNSPKTSRPFKALAISSLLLTVVIVCLPQSFRWLEWPLLVVFVVVVIISLFVPVNE